MTYNDAMSILDSHHETLLSAGNYSGEGCWFRSREEEEIVEEYAKVRAAIAKLIEAVRAGREVQTHNGSVLKFDELQSERLSDALRAVGGAE